MVDVYCEKNTLLFVDEIPKRDKMNLFEKSMKSCREDIGDGHSRMGSIWMCRSWRRNKRAVERRKNTGDRW